MYSHHESITALCAQLQEIGERGTQLLLLEIGTGALGIIYKAHKFLLTRGDLDYPALWILYAANSRARIEVVSRVGASSSSRYGPEAGRTADDAAARQDGRRN